MDLLVPLLDAIKSHRWLAIFGLTGSGIVICSIFILSKILKFVVQRYNWILAPLKFGVNLIKGVKASVSNVKNAIFHPIDTLKGAVAGSMDLAKNTITGTISAALNTPKNIINALKSN